MIFTEKYDEKYRCSICKTVFASRNKLFKHVRLNTCSDLTPADDLMTLRVALYACGGRNRGITLNTCERLCTCLCAERAVGNGDGSNIGAGCDDLKWESISPLQSPRGSHVCASMRGRVYAIGGGGVHSNLAVCEVYDPTTNTWSHTAPMDTFRHALACVAVGERYLYAIGGWVDGSVSSNHNERYDAETDTWELMSALPTPRRLLGAACMMNGSAIYVFGGSQEDEEAWYCNAAERYAIATDSWEAVSPMPVRGACSAAAVDNQYCFVFVHQGAVLRYDIASDTYLKCSEGLPLDGWASFDVKPLGRRSIVVGGGAINGKSLRAMYMFDTINFSWLKLPDLQVGRRRTGLAVVKAQDA